MLLLGNWGAAQLALAAALTTELLMALLAGAR